MAKFKTVKADNELIALHLIFEIVFSIFPNNYQILDTESTILILIQ